VIHADNFPGIGGKVIPRNALDGILATQARKVGITVLDGQEAKEIRRENDYWIVSLDSAREVRGEGGAGNGFASWTQTQSSFHLCSHPGLR
jgi:flavin-dependent dehydrogenase